MKFLSLALMASLGFTRAERRSRAVAVAVAETEIDILPKRNLDERFLLTTITQMTVTDGPSQELNKSMIDSWTQTAHYAR